jgi:formylglycine-generating enzyme required for sulfatase activity
VNRKGVLALAGIGMALGLTAAVVVLAIHRSAPPARCAPGMEALGPRCCGEGQRLEGGLCAGAPRRCAAGLEATNAGCMASARAVAIAGGTLRIGPGDWEAQGQITPRTAEVPAFAIDVYEVSEARYAACVAASACEPLPLRGEPGRAVSGVTLGEATQFCAWAGGALPTSDQLAFAAAGAKERRYAWGDTGAVCRRAAWGLVGGPCGEGALGPEITGSHPDGASPEGVHDLAGNVAEWARPSEGVLPVAEVRGGSWADGAASALRSWNRREVPVGVRSAEIGLRCVYPLVEAERAGGVRPR